jgi:hypothetical protein
MKRAKAFSTINWRKYIDVKVNPRAKSFLESRGDDVFWQISTAIHKGIKLKEDAVVMLVHPNAGAVIRIPQEEYKEFLELSLTWFEKKEDYDKCIDIKWFLSDHEAVKRGIKPSKKYREKVI